MSTEAYVDDAIRTPRGRGKADGALHGTKPTDLVVGLPHETLRRFPDLGPLVRIMPGSQAPAPLPHARLRSSGRYPHRRVVVGRQGSTLTP